MEFTLKRKEIRAMLRFAGEKDIRYYLNGICVTQDDRGTIAEATNGHVLGRVLLNEHNKRRVRDDIVPARVIIGRADAEKLRGTKRQGDELVHFTVTGKAVTAVTHDATMTFQALDGNFPDTERVTPKVLKEEKPAHYNPEYIMAFALAAEDLCGKKQSPRIIQQGDDAALVALPTNYEFVGVVMPIRSSHIGGDIPNWIYESPIQNQPAQAAA